MCGSVFTGRERGRARQDFEIYRQFVGSLGGPSEKMKVATDGNVYGTDNGGDFGRGEIFRLVPDGNGGFGFERLYSFHGPDGIEPLGIVQGYDGRFYGATLHGGALGGGTVYAYDLVTGLVVFHNFPLHPFYGAYNRPGCSGLRRQPVRRDRVGGFYGFGTIFRVTPPGVLPASTISRARKAPGPSARSSSPPTAFSTGPRRSGEAPVSAVDRPVPVTAATARSSERIFRAT